MTYDEEMAARGRLITDYSEIKKRMAVLKSEANRIGHALQQVGRDLVTVPTKLQIQPELDAMLKDPQKLRDLIEDLSTTEKRLIELQKNVAELNL